MSGPPKLQLRIPTPHSNTARELAKREPEVLDPDAGPITDRERAFARALVGNGFVLHAAMIEAGYSEAYSRAHAYVVRRRPRVQAEVTRLIEESIGPSDEIRRRLALMLYAMAFSDITQAYTPDGEMLPLDQWPEGVRRLFQGLTKKPTRWGEVVSPKFESRQPYLQMLRELLGLGGVQRVDVTSGGKPIEGAKVAILKIGDLSVPVPSVDEPEGQ